MCKRGCQKLLSETKAKAQMLLLFFFDVLSITSKAFNNYLKGKSVTNGSTACR